MSRTRTYVTKETPEGVKVEDITEVEESVMESVEGYEQDPETEQKSEFIVGIVIDCSRLRVRSYPELDANVICEIDAGAQVVIDNAESTEDFYKVCTETGIDGYCMQKFIKID